MRRTMAIGALFAAACGPIQYLSTVTMDASHVVAEAKSIGAEERFPYEYTAAVEYLHKARDLGGYARYQNAVALGRKAAEFAASAVRQSRQLGASPQARAAPEPSRP